MNVLVIGSGGREHAICRKISESPRVDKVFCAPGNGGTGDLAENVNIKADDINGLLDFAKTEKVDLTCVGPEVPLVAGIVDTFLGEGLKIFGPSGKAALLEGSKIYAKEMMKKYGIPTAEFEVFDDPGKARVYVEEKGEAVVVKADGLAAGKGVTVCRNAEEAYAAISDAMENKIFGLAGSRVIIEETLSGEEASILAICDGKDKVILASSQDHKRALDGDKGPNTGGMGAYSPAPVVTGELSGEIEETIIDPLLEGMAKEGNPFKGVLYTGVMITETGPKVLEFNARFGDPETQVILPRMKTDLVELMELSISGGLSGKKVKWSEKACVCVVLASGGYPAGYDKGKVITGCDIFRESEDVMVFHAGTTVNGGKIVSSGGRVLNVVGLGDSIKEAIQAAYGAVDKIDFDKMHYRKDIGYRALQKHTVT